MTQHKIQPEKIKSPIQLLAVWFVALVVLDGEFLAAAGVVSLSSWLQAVLVIAAVVNVPVFLCCMFLLQTRFRPEMQSDEHYAEYVIQRKKTELLASQVRKEMNETGVGLADLIRGREINASAVEHIRPLVNELNEAIRSLWNERSTKDEVDPDSLRALAHGELAIGNWLAAAKTLSEYAKHRPDDFEANFSRGVAYANARGGHKTDLGALRAYNDAIVSLPESLDPNYRARLFTYRGAMLKRMHRFEEALADFRISESSATNEYEVHDLLYNLASTYAMMGDRNKMMAVIRRIPPNSKFISVIRTRLADYFSAFSEDKEFLQLIGNG
jgi:tetratricopeptide (TPR) repeat protein